MKEPVFWISIILVIFLSFFSDIDLQAIDWKVIIALFNLMAVIAALGKYRVLDKILLFLIQKFTSIRYLGLCLVFLTGFFAMFITNDVALLTMVPLTILIAKKCRFNPIWLVIYQTLAANVGSSLTPMGNPQNLFLYEFFRISNLEFISILLPFVVIGFIIIFLLLLLFPPKHVHYKSEELSGPNYYLHQIVYLLLFGLVVLSILRFLDYRVIFIGTLFIILFLDRDIFLRIDYFLLGTFIAFFLFVSSLSHLAGVTETMSRLLLGEGHTFLWGSLVSQIISNVPAAILLANFSGNYRELLLGVNVGGMGTLVASLASLISYKLYCKEYPGTAYLVKFHAVNFSGLIILTSLFYLYLRWF
jgi:Na+/H+ antiporter NhaD/arsenite permease-like protein